MRHHRQHGRNPEIKSWTVSEPDQPLHQAIGRLSIETWSKSFIDITGPIDAWINEIGAKDGLITVFIRHTSASLTIQENADTDVQRDLLDALDRLAPQGAGYRHSMEGPDDMPAHVKSALTATSLVIPVLDGALDLGTWQAVYVIEHRASNHTRTVTLTYQGGFKRLAP